MKSKKYLNRILAWSLCMALALSAWLPVASASAASGGFAEKELATPEGYETLTAPAALPGGGFAQAGKRGDTGAWELLTYASLGDAPAVTPLEVPSGELSSISVAPDGQILAMISTFLVMRDDAKEGPGSAPGSGGAPGSSPRTLMGGPENQQTSALWYDQSGAITASLTVPGMVICSAALSGRRVAAALLGMGGSNLAIYDDQGGLVTAIDRSDVSSIAAGPNDGLYIVHQQEKVTLVDQKGQTVDAYPSIQGLTGSLASAPGGALYLAGLTGIYRLEAGAAEPTLLADAARYLIGAPDSNLSGLCAMDDGTLIVQLGGNNNSFSVRSTGSRSTAFSMIGEGGESSLVAYEFNPDLDMNAGTAFTVTALRDSTKVRKAVSDFQRAHPELTVNLNVSLAADDTDSPVEDAIRTLNTDLLSGNGGDILILDEMPLAQYINRGVLLPLDDFLAGIDFLPGILEGSRAADGKLYAVPAQFQFNTLWGNRDALAGVDTLDALANMRLDNAQELLYPRTPEDLLKLFYPASQSAFIDDSGKPRFDTPAFESFLEALYQIYAAQSFSPTEVPQAGLGRRMGSMEEIQGMLNGSVAVIPSKLTSTMETAMPYTIAGATESLCIPVPSLNGTGRSYIPSVLPGISARTTNRALCEEFLCLLYAPEIQELESMEGLPTVAASLDALVGNAKEVARGGEMRMAISFGGNPLIMEQLNDGAWDALRALCGTLNEASVEDPTLMGFMVDETASFFEGYASAQDAAGALQQRASAYLNE